MICLNCGRKLKSVASREAGYGSVCYRKMFGISLRSSRKDRVSQPSQQAVILYHNSMRIRNKFQGGAKAWTAKQQTTDPL